MQLINGWVGGGLSQSETGDWNKLAFIKIFRLHNTDSDSFQTYFFEGQARRFQTEDQIF
jgi:hypothetical protein